MAAGVPSTTEKKELENHSQKKKKKKKKPVLEMKPFILSPCVLNLPDKWERSAEKDSSMNNKKKIKVTLFAHLCFNFS